MTDRIQAHPIPYGHDDDPGKRTFGFSETSPESWPGKPDHGHRNCERCADQPKWCPAGRVAVKCPMCGGWSIVYTGDCPDCTDGYATVTLTMDEAKELGADGLTCLGRIRRGRTFHC